jgi:manganese oxidase
MLMFRNAVLVVALCFLFFPINSPAKVRHYYVAAEDVQWNYAPSGYDLIHAGELPVGPRRAGVEWAKTRYIEYTDASFSKKKPQPPWLGILGPIIRAEVGDTILVHFLNRSARPHGIHPHGLRYDKDSEGALYVPFGRGALVPPGARFTYRWFADDHSGPRSGQQSSIVWVYHPHVDEPVEANAGLIGPIIITKAGKAKPDGSPKDADREFVALFMIFDELRGKEDGLFHTINGYVFGNLPGFSMVKGQKVRWHLFAMGNEKDLHTPHWHGKTVPVANRYTDVIELLPASMVSVDMLADNPGTWLFHCQVSDHMEAGMMATFSIHYPKRACPVKFTEGDFWYTPEKFLVTARNQSSKSIKKLQIALEYFSRAPNNLRGFADDWKWQTAIPVNAEKTFELQEYFHEKGLIGYLSGDRGIIGWAVMPKVIEYSDGSTWKPREHGECHEIFWRDEDHPFLEGLPPLQPNAGLEQKH